MRRTILTTLALLPVMAHAQAVTSTGPRPSTASAILVATNDSPIGPLVAAAGNITPVAAADAAAKQAEDAASAPTGGLSVVDAFRKELGLRLERQPGTYPALILDHIEQTPTEN